MAAFRDGFPSECVRSGVALSTLTTWRVGGPVELLVRAGGADDAERAVHMARDAGVACRVVGWGSNLLASDGGIKGVVIRPAAGFNAVRFEETRIVAESGCGLSRLAGEAALRGLAGLEFAVGIPGTIGGAVAVNAGAEGSEVSRIVETITVLRRSGIREIRSREDLQFSYRHSRLLNEPAMVLEVALALRREDPEEVRRRTQEFLAKRARQPKGSSAGSVFRNPEGDFAGRLLDRVGAKGMRVGGASVPRKHANFILTETGASAANVLDLMRLLQERVVEETGILLLPEVVFAGFSEEDRSLPKGARLLREMS